MLPTYEHHARTYRFVRPIIAARAPMYIAARDKHEAQFNELLIRAIVFVFVLSFFCALDVSKY